MGQPRSRARRVLFGRAEETKGDARANFDVAYWVASAYAMLGDADEAFEWLGRAIDVGNENRRWFESDPHWEPLREDPRFAELMGRIGDTAANSADAALDNLSRAGVSLQFDPPDALLASVNAVLR